MKPEFKIGDPVTIVKYGHNVWDQEEGTIDLCPELVGKQAIVAKVVESQGKFIYSLSGVNKVSWYNEDQLILT